jgi:hypothetical protein
VRRLLIPLLVAAVATSAAQAAGPSFGLRAVGKWKLGYFVYDAKPGATVSGEVAVTNEGDRGGIVRLFSADSTTGQTSGAVYLTSGHVPREVGAWITLPATTVELGPKEQRIIPFTVHVPARTAAGQHVGGIVAETVARTTSPKSKGKTNVQITVRNLTIVAVQVNVPGPRVARLSIGHVTAGGRKGYQQVFVQISNNGNVMVKPTFNVTITDAKGAVILTERLRLDSILPHTSIDYPVNVTRKALGAGTYRTQVQLSYAQPGGGRATALASPPLTVTPQNVGEVFTSATPPTPPPAGTPAPRTAQPATPAGKGLSSTRTTLAIVLGVLAAGALLAAAWLGLARGRRPRSTA